MAKVTIQDIAKELGLSRNTVSKAINNTGILADSTKQLVLKKAAEMGYKMFLPEEPKENNTKNGFVLFTGAALNASHFASRMLDEMQQEAALLGYGFSIYRIMPQELKECRLPSAFDISRTAGIFCVEVFDMPYSKMLCDLDIPVVFIDTAVTFKYEGINADVLLMENRRGIYAFIKEMVKRGRPDIGFAGEAMHCMSFYERYDAYRGALDMFDIPFHREWSLTGNSSGMNYPTADDYLAYLETSLKSCERLPSVMLCANDFVAIQIMEVLRRLNVKVPEDMYICGFDDAPEAHIIKPALTTIRINSKDMGHNALSLMLSRIAEPERSYRTVYTQSLLVYRDSSGDRS